MQICRPESALLGHLVGADLNVTQSADFQQDSLSSAENYFNISRMDFKTYKNNSETLCVHFIEFSIIY